MPNPPLIRDLLMVTVEGVPPMSPFTTIPSAPGVTFRLKGVFPTTPSALSEVTVRLTSRPKAVPCQPCGPVLRRVAAEVHLRPLDPVGGDEGHDGLADPGEHEAPALREGLRLGGNHVEVGAAPRGHSPETRPVRTTTRSETTARCMLGTLATVTAIDHRIEHHPRQPDDQGAEEGRTKPSTRSPSPSEPAAAPVTHKRIALMTRAKSPRVRSVTGSASRRRMLPSTAFTTPNRSATSSSPEAVPRS